MAASGWAVVLLVWVVFCYVAIGLSKTLANFEIPAGPENYTEADGYVYDPHSPMVLCEYL